MRAIDADAAIAYLENHKKVGKENGYILAADEDAIIKFLKEKCPTLTPPNEPLTCVGCIYEPDCPSEIHCHGCARIFVDHYRRPPEGEA